MAHVLARHPAEMITQAAFHYPLRTLMSLAAAAVGSFERVHKLIWSQPMPEDLIIEADNVGMHLLANGVGVNPTAWVHWLQVSCLLSLRYVSCSLSAPCQHFVHLHLEYPKHPIRLRQLAQTRMHPSSPRMPSRCNS